MPEPEILKWDALFRPYVSKTLGTYPVKISKLNNTGITISPCPVKRSIKNRAAGLTPRTPNGIIVLRKFYLGGVAVYEIKS
jgi:hypothetical protein